MENTVFFYILFKQRFFYTPLNSLLKNTDFINLHKDGIFNNF